MLIVVLFVKLSKDGREGWEHADDEDDDDAVAVNPAAEPDLTSGVELRRAAQTVS